MDRVNALLSFVYTMLYHDIRSALETCGLDPAAGFLHRDRPGRMSLALDMMEEFRPFFADRLVLSLVNLQKVRGKEFSVSSSGAVRMNDKCKKNRSNFLSNKETGCRYAPPISARRCISDFYSKVRLFFWRGISVEISTVIRPTFGGELI